MKRRNKVKSETVTVSINTPRILIAIPCMDTVPVAFMTSLVNLEKPFNTHYAVHANSMIYDSRNTFAAKAITGGYDRVLWLDSDMVFDHDMLTRLNADMNKHGLDFVSGIFFKRRMPTGPCIYRDLIYGANDDGTVKAEAIPYTDYPRDDLFETKGAGFGAVLMTTDLLKAVWEAYGPPFQPLVQMGEDLSFCWRVTQIGRKMWCDSRVKVGHAGLHVFGEETWDKQQTEQKK